MIGKAWDHGTEKNIRQSKTNLKKLGLQLLMGLCYFINSNRQLTHEWMIVKEKQYKVCERSFDYFFNFITVYKGYKG